MAKETVKELKAQLKQLGLSTTGKKAELQKVSCHPCTLIVSVSQIR